MFSRYIEVSTSDLPVAECCRGTTKLRSLHSWSAQLDLLPFNSLFRVPVALIARDSLASEFSQFQAWDFHRYHQWVSPEVTGHSFHDSYDHYLNPKLIVWPTTLNSMSDTVKTWFVFLWIYLFWLDYQIRLGLSFPKMYNTWYLLWILWVKRNI